MYYFGTPEFGVGETVPMAMIQSDTGTASVGAVDVESVTVTTYDGDLRAYLHGRMSDGTIVCVSDSPVYGMLFAVPSLNQNR